jgi:hypothetical protein
MVLEVTEAQLTVGTHGLSIEWCENGVRMAFEWC